MGGCFDPLFSDQPLDWAAIRGDDRLTTALSRGEIPRDADPADRVLFDWLVWLTVSPDVRRFRRMADGLGG